MSDTNAGISSSLRPMVAVLLVTSRCAASRVIGGERVQEGQIVLSCA